MTIDSNIITYTLDKAKALGADKADVISINSSDVSVGIRQGDTESIERAESSGIGLRVFVDNKQAIVSASNTSTDTLDNLIQQAIAMAKSSPEDKFSDIARQDQWIKETPTLHIFDDNEPSIEQLKSSALETEDAALSTKGITNSEGAEASYSTYHVQLANSHGFYQQYQSSLTGLSTSVIAGEGEKMERDYAFSTARFFQNLTSAKELGQEAARRTLARLNPKQPSTCQVPVIFEPRIGKSLVSNFIGAISGSAIARGTSFLINSLNTEVFHSNITIINDPHRKSGLGSKPFDAEGLPCQVLHLIDKGILTTWLLDIRSANKLGMVSNGCASRGMNSAPSPSAHNVYIDKGSVSPQELMSDIKRGFYVTETFGSGVNLVTGDYSQGAAGFWIENGEITYPVSELTIAGNLKDMFKSANVANDLEFRYSVNAPTMRIEGMMVAGQ